MVVTFRGRRKESPRALSTFRDRCNGLELSYFELQISWQVQHFGHGGDRRGAQIS